MPGISSSRIAIPFHLGGSSYWTQRLIFADEFDVDGTPDPTKWDYEIGITRPGQTQYSTNRPENVVVDNGNLVITTLKEEYLGSHYTSASIITLGKASFAGDIRVEVRAKLPQGQGIWPSIWMMGEDFPTVGWPECGEIDIMEWVSSAPNTIQQTLIWKDTLENITDKALVIPPFIDLSTNYHVYGLERKGNVISLFVDDVYYMSLAAPAVAYAGTFVDPLYLLLMTSLGKDAWSGTIDDAILPQKFYIDYVRVYSIKNLIDHLPIEGERSDFVLTPTGDGTGIAKINMRSNTTTTLTLSAGASFYTDAAGTLGQSQTWVLTRGLSKTRYIKCTSSSTLSIVGSSISEWNEWISSTNAPNISGDISKFTLLTVFRPTGNNTLYGSIAGLTSLLVVSLTGTATISGSIAGLTLLRYFSVSSTCTITVPNVTNLHDLCYLGGNTKFLSANVNQILADFVANKDYPKPRSERVINVGAWWQSQAPTGQGIIDKAALAAYRSPNNDGANALWTVTTK